MNRALGAHPNGVKLIVTQFAQLGNNQKRQPQQLRAQSDNRVRNDELNFALVNQFAAKLFEPYRRDFIQNLLVVSFFRSSALGLGA